MDYNERFEEWRKGYKRENDPLFKDKVKLVRDATGFPMQKCMWMVQICNGHPETAVKLLKQVPPRVWC